MIRYPASLPVTEQLTIMIARKRIGILLVLVLFAGIGGASAQIYDCDITWLQPLQLSSDSVPSNAPQVISSGSIIHAAWFGLDTLGTVANDGIQYARSLDGGATFTPQVKIVSADTALDAGVMAVSGDYIYIAFFAITDTFYGTTLIRSTDGGMTWESPDFLLGNTIPRVIAAQDSIVYIHYYNQLTNRYGLLRSGDNGTTWATRNTNMPSFFSIVPYHNLLYAVNETDISVRKEVGFFLSPNSGTIWYGPEILSSEDVTSSTLPALAVNEEGDIFVTWNDTGSIVMRRSYFDEEEGMLWYPQIVLSQNGGSVFSDVSAKGNFAGVVWDNQPGSENGIRLRTSNDRAISFCPETLPALSPAASAPSIAISGDNIYLLWSDKVGTNSEILFQAGKLIEKYIPQSFSLYQNYPNPFNSGTTIQYDISEGTNVTLTVYNILGQKVATLVNEYQSKQQYSIPFYTDNLATGVYFYRLRTNTYSETKKMVIVR